ncbi:hypothetical protein AEGHOMDF_5636 [Methylobacterium soli]|nr:hypothetical protein AEGHOMDF_5636 [Methylobacterium soli]
MLGFQPVEISVSLDPLSTEECRILRILDKFGPQRAIYDAASIKLRERGYAKLDAGGSVLVITDAGKEAVAALCQV